jgi:rare lipoprotein A
VPAERRPFLKLPPLRRLAVLGTALAVAMVGALALGVGPSGCASSRRPPVAEPAPASTARPRERAHGPVQRGIAVWYGAPHHGKPTANGERFDMHALTAAHRSLPFGTRVRVTNQRNGRSVVVRINDRGPFGKNRRRIIDLSQRAAAALDIIDAGSAPVTLEVVSSPR